MEGIKNKEVIFQELNQLRDALWKADEATDDFPNSAKIHTKVTALREKYPDYKNYVLYHLLTGSTPHDPMPTLFDFPGDDSIETFLRSF